jgi:hypothetical protein
MHSGKRRTHDRIRINVGQRVHEPAGPGRQRPARPGTYSVALTDARAFTSKAGKEVLVCELRIVDGAQEGYKWSVLMGFQSEGAAGVAKSFCSGLGVDVDNVEPPIENLNDR